VQSGLVTDTIYVGNGAHALRISPDGKYMYVALSKEDAVAVVDIITGEVLRKIPVGKKPEQIDLSRDGLWLFASNFDESIVSVIDVEKRIVIATISVGKGAYVLQSVHSVGETGRENTHMSKTEFQKNQYGYVDISAIQLSNILSSRDVILINVHIPYEGELPDTDLFIPYNQIAENINKLPHKNAMIVLYCRSESMSTFAAKVLTRQGYTNIHELNGGFTAWKAARFNLLYKSSY
jgi:YVTN family beta-propeller protein